MDILKRLGDTDEGITLMSKAARKGPAGIQWLKRGGAGHKHVVRIRFGARILKSLRLRRPQQLLTEVAKKHRGVRKALWATLVLTVFAGVVAFIEAARKISQARRRPVTV